MISYYNGPLECIQIVSVKSNLFIVQHGAITMVYCTYFDFYFYRSFNCFSITCKYLTQLHICYDEAFPLTKLGRLLYANTCKQNTRWLYVNDALKEKNNELSSNLVLCCHCISWGLGSITKLLSKLIVCKQNGTNMGRLHIVFWRIQAAHFSNSLFSVYLRHLHDFDK